MDERSQTVWNWSLAVSTPPKGYNEHGVFEKPDTKCVIDIGLCTGMDLCWLIQQCPANCKHCAVLVDKCIWAWDDLSEALESIYDAGYEWKGYKS